MSPDFDSVLDYEKDCYKEGYENGFEAGHKLGHLEGRELGIQTGFQRYRSLGIIQGRRDLWLADPSLEGSKAKTLVEQLEQYATVTSLENDPVIADKVDLQIKKAKTKLRLMAASTKSPPVELYESALVFQKDQSSIEDL